MNSDENYDSSLEPLVKKAKEDLAQRLNTDVARISVVSAETKQWPDASAGCPRPGMVYAQMVTDGAEIILSADDDSYRYTSGGSSQANPTLCN